MYFSPIHDDELPDVDALYIGGGYPEVFKEELSSNKSMLKSIKNFSDNNLFPKIFYISIFLSNVFI